MSEHILVYEYEVDRARAAEFEAVYGSSGPWAELFSSADGFRGTDLYRDAEREGRYLVVDRWRSAADQRAFLEARREEYDALGRRTEALWTAERRIGPSTWSSF